MSELIDKWFSDAREKHTAAQRLALLLVAFFAILQVTTFDQYLAFQQQLSSAQVDMGEAAQTSSVLSKAGAIAKELNQTTRMRLEDLLQGLVEDLQEDSNALDRTIAILSRQDCARNRYPATATAAAYVPSCHRRFVSAWLASRSTQ